MFGFLDDIFCAIEGKTERKKQPRIAKVRKGKKKAVAQPKNAKAGYYTRLIGLIGMGGLDGIKDDREKFKIDLINDIKTFLFTKWEKPWVPALPFDESGRVLGFMNLKKRVYRNLSNLISLERRAGNSPFFATLKEVSKQGAKITNKAKIAWVVSFVPVFKDKPVNGFEAPEGQTLESIIPKFHQVINAEYTEGLKTPRFKMTEFKELELNEYIENFLKAIKNRLPKLYYDQVDRCFYKYSRDFSTDEIHLVPIKNFKGIGEYYSTLFHEIIHSTKRPSRADRQKNGLDYANEELVAEMGASLLAAELGLEYNRQNTLAYLTGWLKGAQEKSKNDVDSILLEAYGLACDAVDYLTKDVDFDSLVPETMKERSKNSDPVNPPIEPGRKEIEPKQETKGEDTPKRSESKEQKEDVPSDNFYKINEDGKIEMHFNYEKYKALAQADKNEIKSYFLWSRPKEAWVSKSKGGFSAENIVKKHGLVFAGKEKRLSFNEEIEKKKERAENRINRYDKKSMNAKQRAESLQSEFNRLRKDWSWLTQPIIKGHAGSERFGRSKARVLANYEKGFEEQNKALYYEHKKHIAESILKGGDLLNIKFVQNRIKDAEKGIRTIEGWLPKYQKELEKGENLSEEKIQNIEKNIEHGLERLNYNYDKLAYYKLAESNLLSNNDGEEIKVFSRDMVKELTKFLKQYLSKTWKLKFAASSSPSFVSIQLRPAIPNELRHSIASFIYPNSERLSDKSISIGNINPTYISLHPNEWHEWLKTQGVDFRDSSEAPEKKKKPYTAPNFTVTKSETTTEPSENVKVENVLTSLIHTDPKRFQNRANDFSEDSKNRIVNAYKNGQFNWSKFDPITIWSDTKTGKWFVLSGHSRLAAVKEISQISKRGENFTRIPSRKFVGTEQEAIDFALNSNTLSTKETEVERAMYYHKQRETCEISHGLNGKNTCDRIIEEKCREAEGKNANYILNLSYLNPKGFLMDSLKRLGIERDNDSTNVIRTIANWIGEARRNNLAISDKQETEIAQFLINGGYGNKSGQFKNKAQFNERLQYAFQKWEAKGAKEADPLNLANTIYKSVFEREHDERLAKSKAELDNAIDTHEEKYKKYLYAVMEGKITQARMDELMKPIITAVDKAKKEYDRIRGTRDEVIKASNAQTSLFGFKKSNAIKKGKTFKLSGDLGELLGEYDRHQYSIVLRGDKGAGKSRLAFQVINAFMVAGLSAGFLSLEMSPESSVFIRYRDQYISEANRAKLQVTAQPMSYDDLNAACKMFDVVAIDSWTKLRDMKQDDFDRLQKENPSTIILAIFQSTTGKVTRGGNMPEFDAGTVIHVHQGGIAECEKNRYTACDKQYSVFDQKLITPVAVTEGA